MQKHKLCARIVSVETWCPQIVASLVLWINIFNVGVEVIERNNKKCRICAA